MLFSKTKSNVAVICWFLDTIFFFMEMLIEYVYYYNNCTAHVIKCVSVGGFCMNKNQTSCFVQLLTVK